jgi:CheY-like chemotaxis protein/anti-sigma regulatory factor (Ser/Thr protein kinase)
MSHELRTPMNAILGYSEMLIEEAEDLDQPDFIPDLQKIHEAGEHLLALINDVLDLSKIEAGRMDLYLESFDVASMIRTIASTVKPLVAKNENELVVECADDLGDMRADVTKLRQSLLNLLSNAAKFTERGTLTLAVTRESDCVRFDVSDTGLGIPPDRIERLFEEFTQADETTSRNFGGTGLGLAISRRFCRMMGGDITVASEVGAGSTFTIVLPAHVADEATSATATESEDVPVPEGEGPLVLVIDDDATACELLERTLERDGFRVVTADNGQDGLRLARELRPLAITLDVIMPGTDGWNVLAALKADPELHEIPVVMVTMLDEQRLGHALGAAEFMTKPVDRERLSGVLARYRRQGTAASVLIVEDQEDTRELLRRVVENEGWEASVAGNGREGLDRVKEARPSLIITDLMMPGMDGFEFIDELRSVEAWRAIPVIVLTAKDLTEEDRNRLSKHVERILDKGSNSGEDLVARLRELVGTPQSE